MGSKIKKVYIEAVPVKNWLISNYRDCILGRIKDFYSSDMFLETIRLLKDYSNDIKDEIISKKIIIPITIQNTDLYKFNESELNLSNISLFGQILRQLCKKIKSLLTFQLILLILIILKMN